ncbi:anthranilate synthase component II [Aureimonas phyllosphaerae]|uniref:Para-aminobenzoate synthetase component 2 n=1 Tax=Aureimonas phyllosphaerae TaxID=1166078 RepID=A0A7W6BW33_9HYPH|nr:aminodeoxychorismate/anthranilate synthase component II [Aureimonas phyllosphaerae]MBB3937149.1 para-aminobenzoate synthetase component 2 [Aureimonas phyllosphaerae]MBB3961214.1 para-aminobenzoate synthetase component 2 [Aureimonas phyllosphaerae]SFF52283.1 aminodeoxychorismate synthase, glutamine amidotransferase subunit [Aureimonas phyllosphaerae]
MILVLDNYDSFTHNLARYLERHGAAVSVVRSDRVDLAGIRALAPRALVLSPGPCGPAEAGICLEAVGALSGRIPILGVCLGHQVIGLRFGGRVERAEEPMHGRASLLEHDGEDLFEGLARPLEAGRYHSLIVRETEEMAEHLRVTARSPAGEIMALSHRTHPTFGIQFHPESVLTPDGDRLLRRFLDRSSAWWDDQAGS